MWRLDGRNEAAGWLAVPAAVDDVDAWVRAQARELRAAWGDRWSPEEGVVESLLRAGLQARPADAAQAFQLWPVAALVVAYVDVAFGRTPPDGGPSTGIRYEAEGLGVGVQTVQQVHDEKSGVTLVGIQISFIAGDATVVATFHPTFGELLTMLIGQFHAFVQSLEFHGPGGARVIAQTPAGFVADASWADSLPAP